MDDTELEEEETRKYIAELIILNKDLEKYGAIFEEFKSMPDGLHMTTHWYKFHAYKEELLNRSKEDLIKTVFYWVHLSNHIMDDMQGIIEKTCNKTGKPN